ncbi:MAG: FAD binding domain-containing protein [Terriglobia bacterium]
MKQFVLFNPSSLEQVVELLGADPERTELLAGGMDLLGRMKKRINTPDRVVSLQSVPGLASLRETAGGLSLGPLVTLTELAENPIVQAKYRAMAEAAKSVGSVQIRNSGTVGGNLCQRPRCWYFRHRDYICLQKKGTTCFGEAGESRYHAILGGGPCYFAHPSDLAPALIAFDATVRLVGPKGERAATLESLYCLPAEKMGYGLTLEPGEILAELRVPSPRPGTRSTYVKFKEKPSFDFSLAGVAAVVSFENGKVAHARIALSGVAPVPWHAAEAEKLLKGAKLDEALARKVAELTVENNMPLADNGYKVPLTKTLVRRALVSLA